MRRLIPLLLLLLSGCLFTDNSPDRCYHLWDPSQKDPCLVMVASETLNISKCSEIQDNNTAERCYSLLMSKGITENVSTCAKLSGVMEDECFARLAERINDSSLCMRINSDYYRDNCVSQIATTLNRPELCDNIALNLTRDACKNRIYEELALQSKDTSYCKLIASSDASHQQDAIDNCIFSMSKKLNDTSYCGQIVNPFSKELCLTGKINPQTCNDITSSEGKEACLYIAAVYSNDPSQCTTMPSASMVDNCYLQIASNTKNSQTCSFISSDTLRQQCIQLTQT